MPLSYIPPKRQSLLIPHQISYKVLEFPVILYVIIFFSWCISLHQNADQTGMSFKLFNLASLSSSLLFFLVIYLGEQGIFFFNSRILLICISIVLLSSINRYLIGFPFDFFFFFKASRLVALLFFRQEGHNVGLFLLLIYQPIYLKTFSSNSLGAAKW